MNPGMTKRLLSPERVNLRHVGEEVVRGGCLVGGGGAGGALEEAGL